MSEEKVYKFMVHANEWAWSKRTTGFPIYAIERGALRLIGYTDKRPRTYRSLSRYVLRYYASNSTLSIIFVFDVESGEPRCKAIMEEINNYDIKASKDIDYEVLRFLKELRRRILEDTSKTVREVLDSMRFDKVVEPPSA